MVLAPQRSKLRTLLVLSRASNLPTVWSNCLAGWLLGGAGNWGAFFWICTGATFLYVGGMFLNDAFDAEFDRQHRRDRPIPSGAIREIEVWIWGFLWLAVGMVSVFWIGITTAILAVLLSICIIIYDVIHKVVTFSPVIMAMCRFFVYLLASSAAFYGVTGPAIWSALALACYVTGLSYIAARESLRGLVRFWPALLLLAPMGLAFLVNAGGFLVSAIFFSALLIIWIASCLYHTWWAPQTNVSYTVSGLIAGMVLVDLLAVLGGTPLLMLVFAALFVAAKVLQRFIPAT